MSGPVSLLSKTSFFAMNRTLRPTMLLVGGQAGEREVEVAGVVDRDHGPAGDGQVLHAGDGELQPLRPPQQPGELDDSSVYRFHIRQPSRGDPARPNPCRSPPSSSPTSRRAGRWPRCGSTNSAASRSPSTAAANTSRSRRRSGRSPGGRGRAAALGGRLHPGARVLGRGRRLAAHRRAARAVGRRPAVGGRDPRTAARAIGAGLRMLHDAPARSTTCPFGPPAWVTDARHPTTELVVCHGDACAPNTLIDDDGQCCGHVDLGDLGVADRWADLAVASCRCRGTTGGDWQDELLRRLRGRAGSGAHRATTDASWDAGEGYRARAVHPGRTRGGVVVQLVPATDGADGLARRRRIAGPARHPLAAARRVPRRDDHRARRARPPASAPGTTCRWWRHWRRFLSAPDAYCVICSPPVKLGPGDISDTRGKGISAGHERRARGFPDRHQGRKHPVRPVGQPGVLRLVVPVPGQQRAGLGRPRRLRLPVRLASARRPLRPEEPARARQQGRGRAAARLPGARPAARAGEARAFTGSSKPPTRSNTASAGPRATST